MSCKAGRGRGSYTLKVLSKWQRAVYTLISFAAHLFVYSFIYYHNYYCYYYYYYYFHIILNMFINGSLQISLYTYMHFAFCHSLQFMTLYYECMYMYFIVIKISFELCCCAVLLFSVHGKQLRSCRDGQLT